MDDVSLHVPSGSTLGILGATGSAKTTFVQLIPRLYDVTSGSVKVAGKDVKNYDLKTLRDNVAMVLQKTCFSRVRSKKTCVGVMMMQQMKKSLKLAN